MAQRNIDATTLSDMLERGERVTVVDVRKGEDHAQDSIPGSVNFDAYDALHAGDERAMEGHSCPMAHGWSRCAIAAAPAR